MFHSLKILVQTNSFPKWEFTVLPWFNVLAILTCYNWCCFCCHSLSFQLWKCSSVGSARPEHTRSGDFPLKLELFSHLMCKEEVIEHRMAGRPLLTDAQKSQKFCHWCPCSHSYLFPHIPILPLFSFHYLWPHFQIDNWGKNIFSSSAVKHLASFVPLFRDNVPFDDRGGLMRPWNDKIRPFPRGNCQLERRQSLVFKKSFPWR